MTSWKAIIEIPRIISGISIEIETYSNTGDNLREVLKTLDKS